MIDAAEVRGKEGFDFQGIAQKVQNTKFFRRVRNGNTICGLYGNQFIGNPGFVKKRQPAESPINGITGAGKIILHLRAAGLNRV